MTTRKGSKVPLRADGQGPASSTEPATWTTYPKATAAGRGLGFVLNGDGIVCIDLDHCLVDGVPTPEVARLLASLPPTYVEVSPSGSGLHVWGRAKLDRSFCRDGVEVYGDLRYITVTGHRFADAPLILGNIGPVVDSLR